MVKCIVDLHVSQGIHVGRHDGSELVLRYQESAVDFASIAS